MHESSRSTLSPSLREKKWLIFVSCQGRVKKKKRENLPTLSPELQERKRKKKAEENYFCVSAPAAASRMVAR